MKATFRKVYSESKGGGPSRQKIGLKIPNTSSLPELPVEMQYTKQQLARIHNAIRFTQQFLQRESLEKIDVPR